MQKLLLMLALLPCVSLGGIPEYEYIIPFDSIEALEVPQKTQERVQPTLELRSEAAFVYDLTTNEAVYWKNSTQQMSIASITKMMTAFIVVTSNVDMNEVITLTAADVALSNRSSARSKLRAGMRFTRERLLNLALMSSENRASAALGRTTLPGGVDTFVEAMNQMASALGMTNTTFVDPIGIGKGNISTAEDLVKLLGVASNEELIREFSTTKWKNVELPTKKRRNRSAKYHNTNALVGFKDWNILVQKTGFTTAAGHCVVMVVDIQGHKYAMIVLNAKNNAARAWDAIKLRHWVEDGIELTNKEVETAGPEQYQVIVVKAKKKHNRKHKRRKP